MEKYNLKDELLAADKRLTGSVSLLGMTALTSPTYNNSMRSVMFCSHLKQFVNLLHPDFPGFFTNAENLVGEYTEIRFGGVGNVALFMQTTAGLVICVLVPIVLFVGYDLIRRKKYEKTKNDDVAALMAELEALKAQLNQNEDAQ